eukprot:7616544-Pyramimonas_sp.AAC.1
MLNSRSSARGGICSICFSLSSCVTTSTCLYPHAIAATTASGVPPVMTTATSLSDKGIGLQFNAERSTSMYTVGRTWPLRHARGWDRAPSATLKT